MADDALIVEKLFVRVVTGETCYPGEGGFSSVSAEAIAGDSDLERKLSLAQEKGDIVTLRCANIDVTGPITNCREEDETRIYVLLIEDLVYRKPRGVRIS